MNIICCPIPPRSTERKTPRVLLLPLALIVWAPIAAFIVFAVRACSA